MTNIPDIPTLAMPVGLPPTGADKDAHYQNLDTKIAAEVQTDSSVRIWTDPALQFSTLAPMVRSAARFYAAGNLGPGGDTLATDTMCFSTWPWEYLSLQRRNGGSAGLPATILAGNIDSAELQTAVQAELAANPRYAALGVAERAQFVADFISGTGLILLDAGTGIGAGAVDPSQGNLAPPGNRRVDLTLIDAGGVTLDPQLCFEMWATIGGDLVTGHPLLDQMARKVKPGVAPLEGGTRIRVAGQGFTAASMVTVGGLPGTDVRVSPDGTKLYLNVPPGAAGLADVVVTTPPQSVLTIQPGVKYSAAVLEIADCVQQSFVVVAEELIEQATEMTQSNTLDLLAKTTIAGTLEIAYRDMDDPTINRAAILNYPLNSPELIAAVEPYFEIHAALIDTLRSLTS